MAKEKKKKINFVYLVLISLIVVCIGVIFVLLNKTEQALVPDFAPGTIDTNAIKEQESGDKMTVTDGGGAVSLSYSNVVSIDSSKKNIKMYFKNPSKSRESIVLELVVTQGDKEYVLSKSDLLPPGYALYNMDLNTKLDLPKGGYKGKFRLTYYNEETGVKQIINTEIDVSIEVS